LNLHVHANKHHCYVRSLTLIATTRKVTPRARKITPTMKKTKDT